MGFPTVALLLPLRSRREQHAQQAVARPVARRFRLSFRTKARGATRATIAPKPRNRKGNTMPRTLLFRSGDTYRLQTDDPETTKQVVKWSFATPAGACVAGGYLRLWIIPKDKADWVAQVLELPPINPERTERQKAHARRLPQLGLPFRFATPGDGIDHAKNGRKASREG